MGRWVSGSLGLWVSGPKWVGFLGLCGSLGFWVLGSQRLSWSLDFWVFKSLKPSGPLGWWVFGSLGVSVSLGCLGLWASKSLGLWILARVFGYLGLWVARFCLCRLTYMRFTVFWDAERDDYGFELFIHLLQSKASRYLGP